MALAVGRHGADIGAAAVVGPFALLALNGETISPSLKGLQVGHASRGFITNPWAENVVVFSH